MRVALIADDEPSDPEGTLHDSFPPVTSPEASDNPIVAAEGEHSV